MKICFMSSEVQPLYGAPATLPTAPVHRRARCRKAIVRCPGRQEGLNLRGPDMPGSLRHGRAEAVPQPGKQGSDWFLTDGTAVNILILRLRVPPVQGRHRGSSELSKNLNFQRHDGRPPTRCSVRRIGTRYSREVSAGRSR